MADHYRTVCMIHGILYSQCRCPSGAKLETKVPCHCTQDQIIEAIGDGVPSNVEKTNLVEDIPSEGTIVWVVFDYNVGPYVIDIFDNPDDAIRLTNRIGYGKIRDFNLNDRWEDVIN